MFLFAYVSARFLYFYIVLSLFGPCWVSCLLFVAFATSFSNFLNHILNQLLNNVQTSLKLCVCFLLFCVSLVFGFCLYFSLNFVGPCVRYFCTFVCVLCLVLPCLIVFVFLFVWEIVLGLVKVTLKRPPV